MVWPGPGSRAIAIAPAICHLFHYDTGMRLEAA